MTARVNPFAALSDDELIAEIAAVFEHDDPATVPDPVYVSEQRRLFVALCDLYGAGNVHLADSDDGDCLTLTPTLWRPGSGVSS